MTGRKRSSESADRTERCRKLADAGLTQAEIAETLHISHDQVHRALRGYRPSSEKRNVAPAPYYRGANWRAGWL